MRINALLALALLAGFFVCSGCAQRYQLTLSNGTKVTTNSKPKLKDGTYYYKDARGEERAISQARVREISPAGQARKETSPFINTP